MGVFKTEESGMTFGSYDEKDVFQIEKSDLYISQFRGKGVKTVEFILWHNEKLLFLEAKSSTPNHASVDESDDKKENYAKYISDISQKFCDSIDLYFSTYVGRHCQNEISEKILALDYKKIDIVFVLVVKKLYKMSMIHFQEKFQSELATKMRIWNIKDFLVIDEDTARKKGLIE